jgi:hypothetical protein
VIEKARDQRAYSIDISMLVMQGDDDQIAPHIDCLSVSATAPSDDVHGRAAKQRSGSAVLLEVVVA